MKQREKLRHRLQKTLVTFHKDPPPPPSAPALLKHPVGGTLSSSCHSPKGHCRSLLLLLLGRVSLTVSMPAVPPPPPPPRIQLLSCSKRGALSGVQPPLPQVPRNVPYPSRASTLVAPWNVHWDRTEQSLCGLSLPVRHLHCWSAHLLNLLSPTLRGLRGQSLCIYLFIY